MNKLSIAALIFLVLYFNPDTSKFFGELTGQVISSKKMSLEEAKKHVSTKLRGIEIEHVSESSIPGYYEIFFANEMVYATDDGKYVFSGNVLDIEGGSPINVTADSKKLRSEHKSPFRADALSNIDESKMVIYRAVEEKYAITVFTDVDCSYCRKLHREIPKYNEKGITVRYLAYPRAGLGSSSFTKMESIWCAEDRNDAMNDAKLRRVFGRSTCKSSIKEHLDISSSFGLSGTPSIVLSNGNLIDGYLPVDKLLNILNS